MGYDFTFGLTFWFSSKIIVFWSKDCTFVFWLYNGISVRIIYFYYLFLHHPPIHNLRFLSCRPFDINATFSTGLVVSSVSWLWQLTVGVNHWYFNCWVLNFFCCLGWAVDRWSTNHWLWGEVCTLGRFVLRWHHLAGIWRGLLLVFQSLQVCLFFYLSYTSSTASLV